MQKDDLDYHIVSADNHSKIYYANTHVGNMKTILRPRMKVSGQSELVLKYHVTAPDNYPCKFNDRECNSLKEAKAHAFTQYHIGTLSEKYVK